jgi:DNA-binding GntR family transcriptional regulator
MRVVLDSLAVRLTVSLLSAAELAEIRVAYLEATAAAGQGDVAAYRDAHRRFHSALFAHAGARLVRIGPRHEPARVRTALAHVYAEDPTAPES